MRKRIKAASLFTLYTVASVRYGSLVLPAAAVAYLLGAPFWLVTVSVVLLVMASAAELFTSVVHAVAQLQEQAMVDHMYEDIERYANGSEEASEEDGPADEAGRGEPIR